MDEEKEKKLIDLIADVKKGVISIEKEYKFSPETKELRDLVFIIHAEVEQLLDVILIAQLFKSAVGAKVTQKDFNENLPSFIVMYGKIAHGAGFAKKLDQVKSIFDLSTKEGEMYQNIITLNAIRVEFAHPKEKKYEKYKKTDERILAYKILKGVVLDLPELDRLIGRVRK